VRDGEGRALRTAAQIAAGQLVDIELADGHVGAQALSGGAREDAKPRPPMRTALRPKSGPRGGGQGSLF
jgi:exodeoxyribonuclease VII large subunit